jgi:endonuclease YncB( thermonuclease family)
MAAVFLGNLVRNRRLLCDTSNLEAEIVLDHCEFRAKDIAREIVLGGFAAAAPGGGLDDAEAAAGTKRSGLWRNPECHGDFNRC